jgi:CheY-like chemotaxis protein/HPt (histidine-containing phosphotransfer) domain-containing protein
MESTAANPSPTVRPARVLVVEDDRALCEALEAALAEDRVTVLRAGSAEEALTALAQTGSDSFDLVLLDLGLPGMDGFSLLERLRKEAGPSRLPVIVLTANQNLSEKLRGFELGSNDYITKPFELVELRARVRAVLRMQRLQMELVRANEQLEKARASAEESGRVKADFLASMSHEIRTPMNGVIAMTGLLLLTDLGSEQRDYVETIRTSGESLLTIINDILHFSKLESGKMEIEHRPFDLRQCIEETLELLATKAAEKNLDLVYHFVPGTPEQVAGDATRLRQVLVNLISNAIKFTPAGEIFVRVESRALATAGSDVTADAPLPHEFQFAVRDTGIGIPKHRLGRLFQSFMQADSSIARQFGGTGLGLAISKSLVELMGGSMSVESDEGKGSTFHFTLRAGAIGGGPASSLHQVQPALSGLRVLLAEDNATMRFVLAEHTRSWGMAPVEAPTSQHALDQIRSGTNVDMAIVDANLQGTDGQSLVRELRKTPRLQHLPVVLLGKMGDRGPVAIDMPRAAYLHKPIQPALLQSALIQVRSGAKPDARKALPASRLDNSMAAKLPLRILLTDDNVINQKVALRLLQQLGYKADTANNGLEAIRALERQPYDIILMDVQMPEMDGLEATRRIRQRQQAASPSPHFGQPIAIIAMTANAMQGDREKCLSAGMDDYLPKPIRPEGLQTALQRNAARLAVSTQPTEAKTSAATPPTRPNPVEPSASVPPPVSNEPALTLLPGAGAGAAVLESPPVDLERLNEFAGGNADNFNELVTLYVKQTAEQLEQLGVALAEPSSERASRLAHSCAGASATCGMIAIVPLLRQVEHLTGEGKVHEATQILPAIVREFERLRSYLQTHKPIALAG